MGYTAWIGIGSFEKERGGRAHTKTQRKPFKGIVVELPQSGIYKFHTADDRYCTGKSYKDKRLIINPSNNFAEKQRKFPGIFHGNMRKFPEIFHRKIRWKCRQLFRGISRNPFRNFWKLSLKTVIPQNSLILGTNSGEFLKNFQGISYRKWFSRNSSEIFQRKLPWLENLGKFLTLLIGKWIINLSLYRHF